jgi:hypothetical protein
MAVYMWVRKMITLIKNTMYYFSDDARIKREADAMNQYLSQATDLFHLEKLESEWFKTYGRK